MSRMNVVLLATLASASFWSVAPAEATTSFLQRNTTLTTSGLSCLDFSCPIESTTTSVTDFSPFDSSQSYNGVANAAQQSSIGPTEIQVKSTTDAVAPYLGRAESYFSVQFSLDDTENFDFTGSSSRYYQAGRAQIELTGPNGMDISAQEVETSQPSTYAYTVNDSGTLGPGTYSLVVDAVAVGPGEPFANAKATLDLTPVPLPAAGVLLLSGLVSLGFLRGTRRYLPNS